MPFRDFTVQIRNACRLALRDQLAQVPPPPSPIAAGMVDLPVQELARRMRALPDRYLHILVLRFGCDIPYAEIEGLLDTVHAAGTAGFALQLLEYGLELTAPPPEDLLRDAARQILGEWTAEAGEGHMRPTGKRFGNMRAVGGGRAPRPAAPGRLPLRTLVAAAVIAALLLAMAVAGIAAVLRNAFRWSVVPDAEGITITATDILREPTAEDYEEMRLYQPALPDGFAHAYTDDRETNYLIDYYHSEDGRRIVLWKTLAGSSAVFRVTNDELDSYEEREADGTTYLYYEHSRHGRGGVTWEIDGFAFMLVTPLDKEEALRMAASVSR